MVSKPLVTYEEKMVKCTFRLKHGRCSNLRLLNEICKSIMSESSFLHFSTVESASVFNNTYVIKGLTINNMHFTIHPTLLFDGTLVTYAFQKINFGNRSNTQSINAQAVNTATTPMSSPEANADITNTATMPIPPSQAYTDMTNTSTMPMSSSSQANVDITNTATTSSSEWMVSTELLKK